MVYTYDMKNNIKIIVIVLVVLIVGGFFIYYQKNKQAPLDTNSTLVTPVESVFGTYVANISKDIYTLTISSQEGESIKGELDIKNFEKDSSTGTFVGTYKNGILLADYTFKSEGTISVNQVIFKKIAEGFVRGYGDVDEATGTRFADLNTIKYDLSVVYKKNSLSAEKAPVNNSGTSLATQITYNNIEYGFNFTLPANWQGYSIVKGEWKGSPLGSTSAQSGPKLLIRNPKWTASLPYEDLPILVFTISKWNAYIAENFSVSAAPIKASELARNNVYVFALPPRWDFDYSLDYKEAQDIIAGKPISTFNLVVADKPQGKLNINVICEQSISYMRFIDKKSADTFIAECKEGKHPEVIEKYKTDLNLGEGVKI